MLAVVQRHGASVFADASTTHGGRPGLSMEALRLQGLRAILVGLPVVGSPTTVHAAAILGTFYGAATGRWLWPLWLVATVLFALDKYRFVMLIGGMAAAVLVVDLFGLAWRRSADSPGSRVTRVASVAAAAGLLGFHLYVYAAQWPRQVQPLITQSEIEMATWVPQHTPATARLLVIQRQHPPESDRYQDSLEWFPYLTRRVMLGVPWGHEWTGDIAREEFLLTVFTRCWAQESLTCFDDTTRRLERQPDYLLLLNPADVAHLAQEIASSGRWVPVFENGGGSVWQRAGLAPGQSAAGSPG
jgi:hypothetical protein